MRHSYMQLICKCSNRVILARQPLSSMTSPLSKRSSMPVPDIVGTLVSSLCSRGFRRTHALVSLLQEMAADPRPRTLADWNGCPSLRERNAVTLYRLMVRLEQAGVVRRVNLGERAQAFQLLLPGRTPDYLVCMNCGGLEEIETPPEVSFLEQNVAKKTGWKAVRHELEFFGLCPSCS
jgi:Fe2+ or Zn2+ uptake regulation protein